MSRRYAGAGLMRRRARSPSPQRGGGTTPSAVLGSALAIEYDPARGFTLDGSEIVSLACQVTGHVISAAAEANQPAYTAADADFDGHPSFTSSAAGADGLYSQSAHGSDLIASGASPYIAWLGKIITTATVNGRILALAQAAAETPFVLVREADADLLTITNGGAGVVLDAPAEGVHLLEFVYNGANVDYYRNGTLVESNALAAYSSAVRRVGLGVRVTGATHADAKHAYFIVATSVTAQQRAALLPFWRARGAAV